MKSGKTHQRTLERKEKGHFPKGRGGKGREGNLSLRGTLDKGKREERVGGLVDLLRKRWEQRAKGLVLSF